MNIGQLEVNSLDYISFLKSRADYTFKMKSFSSPKNIYLRFIVWMLKSFGNFFLYFRNEFKDDKKNVLFIVHGDTTTSAIGAIIAKLCRVKLIHIESGLRSYNFLEPFPEEINRFIISHLTDIHFSRGKNGSFPARWDSTTLILFSQCSMWLPFEIRVAWFH